jgi:hypothetical protein
MSSLPEMSLYPVYDVIYPDDDYDDNVGVFPARLQLG